MNDYYRPYLGARHYHVERLQSDGRCVDMFVTEPEVQGLLGDDPPAAPYKVGAQQRLYFDDTTEGRYDARLLCAQLSLLSAGFRVRK